MSDLFYRLHSKRFFDSYEEYEEFERRIEQLIKDGDIKKVPVTRVRKIGEEHERWFLDLASNEVYRYIPPDFPAKGSWERVR